MTPSLGELFFVALYMFTSWVMLVVSFVIFAANLLACTPCTVRHYLEQYGTLLHKTSVFGLLSNFTRCRSYFLSRKHALVKPTGNFYVEVLTNLD
jgi:hypothetical protein